MEAESADGDRQTRALQALRLLVEWGLTGQMANLEARVAELEAEVVHGRQLREAVQQQVLCPEAELDLAEAALTMSQQQVQHLELQHDLVTAPLRHVA